MHSRLSSALIVLGATVWLALTGCVHTPPGTSVKVALAKKALLVQPVHKPVSRGAFAGSTVAVPPVEPELPRPDGMEPLAEAYSRGEFYMEVGRDTEAIEAFGEAVKIDPNYSEAWQRLAVLYEKVGDAPNALEAARQAKNLAKH